MGEGGGSGGSGGREARGGVGGGRRYIISILTPMTSNGWHKISRGGAVAPFRLPLNETLGVGGGREGEGVREERGGRGRGGREGEGGRERGREGGRGREGKREGGRGREGKREGGREREGHPYCVAVLHVRVTHGSHKLCGVFGDRSHCLSPAQ